MKNPRQKGTHNSDMVFVLTLFACLVLIGLLLISMGTGVFQNILDSMNSNDRYRTASAYITQKVRQHQEKNAVREGSIDGYPALVLTENIDGGEYMTYLYCDGSHLKELLARADNTSLGASAGSDIIEMRKIEISDEGTSLLVTMTENDGTVQVLRVAAEP